MPKPALITQYSVCWSAQRPGPPLRVAAVADLHVCKRYTPLDQLEIWVRQTNDLGCDLIVLLGDYVGHVWGGQPERPDPVADCLAHLRAPLGVFAVFGNHDWRDDPLAQAHKAAETRWHAALRSAGLRVLSNSVERIETPQGPVQLAGLESQRAYQTFWRRADTGADDLSAVIKALDPAEPTLMLAHEPDIFPELPMQVDLTLSGHTHGGQIAPFGLPLIVPSKYGRRFAYGAYQNGAQRLIVSGGLGYSGPPIRWGRPPEIVMVEIS